MSTTIVAEIGCNHLGWPNVARRLIDAAAEAGCDFVKGQKRDPATWRGGHYAHPHPRPIDAYGLTYREHRAALEIDIEDHVALADYAQSRGIGYVLSAWDVPSAEQAEAVRGAWIKVPSACVTDEYLLRFLVKRGGPVVLSTGMSTIAEIDRAVAILRPVLHTLLACTSTYPTPPGEVNLRTIETLRDRYRIPVGVSGHWEGVHIDTMAVALGATMIERHITLSQRLPGTDHAASLEPGQLRKLVRNVRECEAALGDGAKRVYASEEPIAAKLRGAA